MKYAIIFILTTHFYSIFYPQSISNLTPLPRNRLFLRTPSFRSSAGLFRAWGYHYHFQLRIPVSYQSQISNLSFSSSQRRVKIYLESLMRYFFILGSDCILVHMRSIILRDDLRQWICFNPILVSEQRIFKAVLESLISGQNLYRKLKSDGNSMNDQFQTWLRNGSNNNGIEYEDFL